MNAYEVIELDGDDCMELELSEGRIELSATATSLSFTVEQAEALIAKLAVKVAQARMAA